MKDMSTLAMHSTAEFTYGNLIALCTATSHNRHHSFDQDQALAPNIITHVYPFLTFILGHQPPVYITLDLFILNA